MNTIGKRIASLRKAKNLTQKELAERLYTSDKTISSWESDRTEPSLEFIVKLSDILDTTTTYLLHGDVKKLDIETEIKIKIPEDEYLYIKEFMDKNAEFIKESKQKDTYYNPKNDSFIKSDPITKWLRIGERSGKVILNYKHWYNLYCDEYEIELDNKETMEKVLESLNIEKLVVVDKLRLIYMYLDKYEVSLDKVENLGYFIEIEVKKYDDTIAIEYDNLLKLAKKFNLNLDNIDKRGYPYHLLKENNLI